MNKDDTTEDGTVWGPRGQGSAEDVGSHWPGWSSSPQHPRAPPVGTGSRPRANWNRGDLRRWPPAGRRLGDRAIRGGLAGRGREAQTAEAREPPRGSAHTAQPRGAGARSLQGQTTLVPACGSHSHHARPSTLLPTAQPALKPLLRPERPGRAPRVRAPPWAAVTPVHGVTGPTGAGAALAAQHCHPQRLTQNHSQPGGRAGGRIPGPTQPHGHQPAPPGTPWPDDPGKVCRELPVSWLGPSPQPGPTAAGPAPRTRASPAVWPAGLTCGPCHLGTGWEATGPRAPIKTQKSLTLEARACERMQLGPCPS